MTTTTQTETPAETILIQLREARAAMADPLDFPHVWTQRQVDEYEARRVALSTAITDIGAEVDIVADRTARRARLEESHALLVRLKGQVEDLIDDTPDYRKFVNRRDGNKAWARMTALHAAVQAIERGVEFFGGKPALPEPLRELLGDVEWPGSIREVEAGIVRLDATIRRHEAQRDQQVQAAITLLADVDELARG